MDFTSTFLALNLQANVKLDSQGNVTGFYEPGEQGYVNIFSTEVSGWQSLMKNAEDYLDFQKQYAVSGDALQKLEWKQEKFEEFLNAMAVKE